MKYPAIIIGLAGLLSGFSISSFAQDKTAAHLLPPPAEIRIDGNIKDWGDTLRYYNPEKKMSYALANDKENLYMAIRITEKSEQWRVLAAGITLNINTKGKKKEMFGVTFPAADADGQNQFAAMVADGGANDQHDNEMRARLTKLRKIQLDGFSDIESDLISTANTYGIKVAIAYDDNGYLDYEAAIPLKYFHVSDFTKTDWAFNFKINGIQRTNTAPDDEPSRTTSGMVGRPSGMGGGMGGMRGGRGRMSSTGMQGSQSATNRSGLSNSVDFWEKFYLTGN